MKLLNYISCIGLLLAVIAGWLGGTARAENIDPDEVDARYAWGENTGWLNAEPMGQDGPGVTVTSLAVTGFIWAENIGWISLSCENTNSCEKVSFGVTNDGSGRLSGYAWSENAGWISLSCETSDSCASIDYGVAIDSATGQFSGYAWGENIGWIAFDAVPMVHDGIVTAWTGGGCAGDMEPDSDVDGSDLAVLAQHPGLLSLAMFASDYGRSNCE
jgi:hypothetical protein